jgi:hypothetical protein
MTKIDRIIKIIREEMAVGDGGFTGSADAKGPTAGYDPTIPGLRTRLDGNIDKRIKKLYKKWLKH